MKYAEIDENALASILNMKESNIKKIKTLNRVIHRFGNYSIKGHEILALLDEPIDISNEDRTLRYLINEDPDSLKDDDIKKVITDYLKESRVRRPVYSGYRFFKCEECNHEWAEHTRDIESPSGEICPKCSEFCHPFDGRSDESLGLNKEGE